MSRKSKKFKRVHLPDSKFQSVDVTCFVNKLMLDGKKSKAENILYEALDNLAKETSTNPLEAFKQSLKNVTPLMEVKSRRVGGSTYQVPVEVHPTRGIRLAMKWIIESARKRSGQPMIDKLTKEFVDAFNETGSAITTKINTHKMAEANKAFSHYRF